MDYKKIKQAGADLILCDIKNFILKQTLDNGQCFRWEERESGYTGIAHGRRLDIALEGNDLVLKNVTAEEFELTWRDYFDLGRSYGDLKKIYTTDKTLNKAVTYSPGLRLMRQDPWETLITFILSQNSNIPRIKGMVARLCENFGQALPHPCGGHTFPEPNALVDADLSPVRTGYRADYIKDAARRNLPLKELQSAPTEDVRKALMEIKGVGPKVADCVLLYGFGRIESYPLDVWMKRVMAEYYPSGFPASLADTAGIAQQFLFHYIRTGIKVGEGQ